MLPVFSFQVQLYQRVDLTEEQAVFYVAYILNDILLYMFVIHKLPPLNFSFLHHGYIHQSVLQASQVRFY